jgi:sortase A
MDNAIFQIDLSEPLEPVAPAAKTPVGWTIANALKKTAEIILWMVAVFFLGWFGLAKLDAYYFQQEQNHRFNALLHRSAENAAGDESFSLPLADAAAAEPLPAAPVVPAVRIGDLIARIDIPRLKVSDVVIEGDDTDTLAHAVGHIPGTALPGQLGNIGLAGHRDSFFRKIGELRDGDTLVLETARGTFRYHVAKLAIVAPGDTGVLNSTGEPALTLVTCYPFHYIGSAPKRFIVSAR